MFSSLSRRDFVKAGAVAALGDFAFLNNLTPVSAADAKVSPGMVQLNPDIEPLVRLIEDTDRSELLELVASRIRRGTSYQQLLTALLLAGVRGIKPRPVGFKFHAVLVVNSAHLASLASPDRERWLPLFWALDNFKSSQAANKKESGWVMPPVDAAKLPSSTQAKKRFIEAMENWDEEGADVAISALVRSAGADEVAELFWRFGGRDFRDIGHKAIYAANSWRTLQTVGWRHAEPVMRSLAFACLEHSGANPAQRDDAADRPWRENLKRAAKIRAEWQHGKLDRSAATEVLAAIRAGSASDACEKVVELLNKSISPASIWDGLFLGAGELLMRQPGIVGLHCVTSTNALHYAYQASGNDETRRLMMLQNAAFLPMFLGAMKGRGKVDENLRIDALEGDDSVKSGDAGIAEILADVSKDRMTAARKAITYLGPNDTGAQELMTASRRLIFNKGSDSHDYKFSSAALEDFYHVTPEWRRNYLASSMFHLKGSGDKDTDLIKRARTVLAKNA